MIIFQNVRILPKFCHPLEATRLILVRAMYNYFGINSKYSPCTIGSRDILQVCNCNSVQPKPLFPVVREGDAIQTSKIIPKAISPIQLE